MKYWMFQNNQVKGPYEPDDLSQLPGFSAESLVCSEGRKGTNMGDWQRASMVPELSVSLLKASQLAVAGKPQAGYLSGLPPEPTLKDLAQLGSLQEKVSLLDGTVNQLQESLRLRENELLSLHRELEEKNRQAQELASKLGGVEERLSTLNTLQTSLDKTAAAEHELESTIQRQSQTIAELTSQIQALQSESSRLQADSAELKAKEGELQDLKSQLEELKNRPSGALAAPSAVPFPVSPPFASKPTLSPFGSPEGLSPAAGEKLTPLAEPKAEGSPLPALTEPPALDIGGGLAPSPAPAAGFGATPGIGLPDAGPLPFSPLSAAAPPAGLAAPIQFSPATAPPPSLTPEILSQPPKRGGGARLILTVVAVAAMAGAYAVKKGLVPSDWGKRAGLSDRTPVPPPINPGQSTAPSPEELAEQQKKEAVELVRAWPVPGGLQTVSQVLENGAPAEGGLSPWMAEKIRDEVYQVNFYSKSARGAKTYEFQASLSDKKVLAHNEPAAALLTPESEKTGRKPKSSKNKSPRIKSKRDAGDQGILEDLLKVPSEDETGGAAARGGPIETAPGQQASRAASDKAAKPARKVKERPRNVTKELDDLMQDEAKPSKGSPKKDASLDELLVPGAGGKPELEEPAAAPASKRPLPAARPAKKGGPAPADAELLDDLLKP
ncbi:MAG: hypothetical protein HY077_18535 [Elusimicrobia bacterium]|nr:hypothetical protein [Elusimicrobiota bacterium]